MWIGSASVATRSSTSIWTESIWKATAICSGIPTVRASGRLTASAPPEAAWRSSPPPCSELGFPVIPLQLVDDHCYHLDTCLCPLNNDAALIYPGAFSPDSLQTIRGGWKRIHELTRDEARQFMGNGIVANGRFITPRLNQNLEQILAQEGLTPVVVDTSEFEKSGGSVFCMKAFIE